ncbi:MULTISPECIES: hypothetical protein [Lactobacillus]|uniref:MarR family transcriptional regulator n=1 Tax=Lactobacillus xujianguonis TaxID=2495899 RepID=A0A437SX55_9LACO|nr:MULTISPECIES: hypothetical protein [Lactobacillus]RVU71516.1 hypothetical protein EJK17_02105 [Lactobacillus xujianguonis]RVU76703.1 hypothetical protein EJK20_04265 [Lactobacillus xujianguonis]
MAELTTKLFLDVKKLEKYQTLLKKQVHLENKAALTNFPNNRIYKKVLRTLSKNGNELTSNDLIFKYNFRLSEVTDAVAALTASDLITKEDISDTECKLKLTDQGIAAIKDFNKSRDEIAQAAYGSLTEDEQKQLDDLVNKLLKDYESRDVDYAGLIDLLHLN